MAKTSVQLVQCPQSLCALDKHLAICFHCQRANAIIMQANRKNLEWEKANLTLLAFYLILQCLHDKYLANSMTDAYLTKWKESSKYSNELTITGGCSKYHFSEMLRTAWIWSLIIYIASSANVKIILRPIRKSLLRFSFKHDYNFSFQRSWDNYNNISG